MKARVLSFVIAASFTLVACKTTYLPVGSLGWSEAKQYTCKKGGACEATVVPYWFGSWTGELDRDPLYLASDNKDVDIYWKFPPNSDYGFCTELGDGVFLKQVDDYNQFDNQSATGNPSGPKKKCKDQYHWRAKNTKAGQAYWYKVIFRDGLDRVYMIDPWIVNGN